MKLSLGCIADDYTGASDLANTLTRCGLRTVQTIGVPSDDLALPEVDAVVVSLKSRSIEAGLAVTRSRAAEKWIRGRGAGHVLFKICSTFDSTDAGNIGPVMDALRADSGDAIVLVTPAFPETGRTVYQGNLFVGSRAAERKPAEGSSAQPDARFQSGAGAGAPEPDQGRAGRSRHPCARNGCRAQPPRRSRRTRALARRSSTPYSTAISKPSAPLRWIIGCRSARPVSASALPGRWSLPARSSPASAGAVSGAPVGGPAACLAGSCSQATLQQIANAEKTMAVLHLDPEQIVAGPGEVRRALGLGERPDRRRPDPDREQFDAGSGRSSAIPSWP